MTKKQKIILAISLALFFIPEILWSPVGNFIYQFIQSTSTTNTIPFRDGFLYQTGNMGILKTTFILQLIGISSLVILMLYKKDKKILEWVMLIVSAILSLAMIFIVYFSFALNIQVL